MKSLAKKDLHFWINNKKKLKKLIFEGAGWSKAESNDVGNCRIRTRIKTSDKRVVYLEIVSRVSNKYDNKNIGEFIGFISHCFYCDIPEDLKNNRSKELDYITHLCFEYTKENILKIVNDELGCNFNELVLEDNGVRVHDTDLPLC